MIKSFAKDMLTYLPTKLLPALTGLITTPILTRLFLPNEYGDWALAVGVSDFLFAFAISGIATATLRFYPAYKAKSDLGSFFTNILMMTGLIVGVVGVLSLMVLILLRGMYSPSLFPLMLISILTFVFHSFYAIFSEVLRVQNKSGLYTRINLFNYYGGLAIGLAMVFAFSMRVEALMYGALLVEVIALPLLINSTMKGTSLDAKLIQTTNVLTIWSFAWPLAFGNTAFWGLRLSDRYVIELFRPGIEVGLYSAVYNISDKTINLLVTLFLMSMGPMVANHWETHGRENTERLVSRLTRMYLILCLPVTVGLSILALPFVKILTGEAYHEGYRIVGYVAFSTFAWGLSRIACWGLILNNKTLRFASNQLLAGAINIGLNLLLVPVYGYVVAAITTLIGYVILLLLQAYTSRSYLTWRIPGLTLAKVTGAAVLMGLVVFGMDVLQGQTASSIINVLIKIAMGAAVYGAALWFLNEINDEEKKTAKRFLSNLFRRAA